MTAIWNSTGVSYTATYRIPVDTAADGSPSHYTTAVLAAGVIASDAELSAIAGLTSAADRLPYFTGSGTASLATFTSFGRTLVDDADASAARTTLGLGSIATQASSSVSITGGSISGITDLAVADGGTGASTAADARTNLGLVIGTDVQEYDANAAKTDVAQEYTATQNFNATTLSSTSNSVAWDAGANQCATLTLTENTTVAAPSNLRDGATYALKIIQDSTPRTVAWNAVFKWAGGTAPTISTGSGAVDILTFYSDGTSMYGTYSQDFS